MIYLIVLQNPAAQKAKGGCFHLIHNTWEQEWKVAAAAGHSLWREGALGWVLEYQRPLPDHPS